MVRNVTSYGGELDDDLGKIIPSLPAAWVTFGGITGTEPYSTSQQKWKSTGNFVVMVGTYNAGQEAFTRQGQASINRPGTNDLVTAVRRLLTGQDLALKIKNLRPGRVRTLFNTQLAGKAVSVFACEFETAWIEEALENGMFPLENAPVGHCDHLFTKFHGATSPDAPDWLTTQVSYVLRPGDETPDATDVIRHEHTDR
jgi:phage gp37-like protein